MGEADLRAEADLVWSRNVAGIAMSTLLIAGVITEDQAERCHAIIAEEVFVRLVMNDRPPP